MTRKILIVEDDFTCETLLKRTIQAIDPSVEITSLERAEDAILALEQDFQNGERYNLIVVDIFLAGSQTGLELWECVSHRFPKTPILIISSLPIDAFFKHIGRNTIAPPFLPKPFRIGECRQMIEGLLAYS